MSGTIGFLHAGDASHHVTTAELARRGIDSSAVHLVDRSLVDPAAAEFLIDDERYAAVRKRVCELATRSERIILTCSVYNGVVPSLREDLGRKIERSDAAAARSLLNTEGTVGVLISYAPSLPIVLDYLTEVFANVEQDRELRGSIAQDAPPFSSSPDAYRNALLEAIRPLRDCDVLFVAQYSMHAYIAELRAAWGDGTMVSAVEAAVAELAA